MDLIKIVNLRQAGMYIKHGVKPVDVDYTDRIVFIFDRNDTK